MTVSGRQHTDGLHPIGLRLQSLRKVRPNMLSQTSFPTACLRSVHGTSTDICLYSCRPSCKKVATLHGKACSRTYRS